VLKKTSGTCQKTIKLLIVYAAEITHTELRHH
jgi:hypothetical protein